MLRWVVDNYRTFLWALALAVAVWISSVTSSDPNQTRALDAPVPVEIIGQSSNLIFSNTIPKEVEIVLRAPNSVWKIIDADQRLYA